MSGLPADLLSELHRILPRCGPFQSDEALEAVFIDQRINTWSNEVPQTTNRRERVTYLVEFLWEKYNEHGENGLLLFLRVLQDEATGDCVELLRELADRVAREVNNLNPPRETEQAIKLIEGLRAAICHKNWDRTKQILADLAVCDANNVVIAEAQEVGEKLVSIADLTANERIYEYIQDCVVEWPDECLAAYISARKKVLNKATNLTDSQKWEVKSSLNKALCILPVDRISSKRKGLVDQLSELERDDPTPIQRRNWPKTEEETLDLGSVATLPPLHRLPYVFSQSVIFYSPRKPISFWGKHPDFDKLMNTSQSTFIYGPRGCGRTTLAKGLEYYAGNDVIVCVYDTIRGSVEENLMRQLCDFVWEHPTRLIRLTAESLTLLADIVWHQYPDNASAIIEGHISAINDGSASWLSEASPEKKRLWQIMGLNQLRRLQKMKTNNAMDQIVTLPQVITCSQILGFNKILVVFDCNKYAALRNLGNDLQSMLELGRRFPFYVLLFYHSSRNHIARTFPSLVEIRWRKEHLRGMVDSQFRLVSERDAIVNYFESETLWDQFLNRYRTPRTLIKALCKVIEELPESIEYGAITQKHLQQVLNW